MTDDEFHANFDEPLQPCQDGLLVFVPASGLGRLPSAFPLRWPAAVKGKPGFAAKPSQRALPALDSRAEGSRHRQVWVEFAARTCQGGTL
jgi:hypothetical protein